MRPHQHRNELSLMYKNKDFLQKTYHHFLYFCSDNNRLLAFFLDFNFCQLKVQYVGLRVLNFTS